MIGAIISRYLWIQSSLVHRFQISLITSIFNPKILQNPINPKSQDILPKNLANVEKKDRILNGNHILVLKYTNFFYAGHLISKSASSQNRTERRLKQCARAFFLSARAPGFCYIVGVALSNKSVQLEEPTDKVTKKVTCTKLVQIESKILFLAFILHVHL